MIKEKIQVGIVKFLSDYLLEFILILYKFYIRILFTIKQLKYNLKYLVIIKSSLATSSKQLNYKKVIEKTFLECYSVLEEANILYFGQINKNCYRFISISLNEKLIYKLQELLNKRYILEIYTAKNQKTLIYGRNYSSKKLTKYLNNAILIRLFRIYINNNGIEEFGRETAFEIEFWKKKGDIYVTESLNYIQNQLTLQDLNNIVTIEIFNKRVKQLKELYHYFTFLEKEKIKEVDIVYTWVDGNDEKWLEKKEKYKENNIHPTSDSKSRYISRDELKYSLRSLQKYLNGYRKVFIVTDSQKPHWLKETENLIIIDHKDIFPDNKILPVFNSHSIETNLHKIKGLSEHYLYINDDIMFSRSLDISLFFPKKGNLSIFPSTSTYIPFGDKHKDMLPVDTAAINTKKLLAKKHIGYAVNKFKHTPLPQIKSILYELENIFLDEINNTRKRKFRHYDDVSLTSSLLYNYAYFKNIAHKQNIKYSYINLGAKNYIFKLKKILRVLVKNRPDVFCINDVDSNIKDDKNIALILNNFLPEKSDYEK